MKEMTDGESLLVYAMKELLVSLLPLDEGMLHHTDVERKNAHRLIRDIAGERMVVYPTEVVWEPVELYFPSFEEALKFLTDKGFEIQTIFGEHWAVLISSDYYDAHVRRNDKDGNFIVNWNSKDDHY